MIGRDDDRDPRTIDTGQPSDVEQAGREHGTGVTGRDDGVGVAVADGADGPNERGVLLVPHGVGRLVVHLDHPLS